MALSTLVLASAGGGSSGFGRGGGGGGLGGGGFGGSGYGGGAVGGAGLVLFMVIWGLVLVAIFYALLSSTRTRRRKRKRLERVHLAAAEAAEDDAAFASDRVTAEAAGLFRSIQDAWNAGDRRRLRELVGLDLLAEWERRLDDFAGRGWQNRVRVIDGPAVEYVGLVNRADDADDRVVVHVTAVLDDYVETSSGGIVMRSGEQSPRTRLAEYWTLSKRDGRWALLSVEQDREGAHNLQDEIVASPWADSRLRDESLVEQAVADRALDGFSPGELADVDFEGDARAAALDLSLADARFAPDVLEAAARRAVAAWAEAVDGADSALARVAAPAAIDALLYGGDSARRTRLVVRGARLEHVRIERLDAAATPPRMTIAVEVRGRRYREDRDTAAVVSGSKDAERRFTERWTLALDGPADAPWRVVDAGGAPAGV